MISTYRVPIIRWTAAAIADMSETPVVIPCAALRGHGSALHLACWAFDLSADVSVSISAIPQHTVGIADPAAPYFVDPSPFPVTTTIFANVGALSGQVLDIPQELLAFGMIMIVIRPTQAATAAKLVVDIVATSADVPTYSGDFSPTVAITWPASPLSEDPVDVLDHNPTFADSGATAVCALWWTGSTAAPNSVLDYGRALNLPVNTMAFSSACAYIRLRLLDASPLAADGSAGPTWGGDAAVFALQEGTPWPTRRPPMLTTGVALADNVPAPPDDSCPRLLWRDLGAALVVPGGWSSFSRGDANYESNDCVRLMDSELAAYGAPASASCFARRGRLLRVVHWRGPLAYEAPDWPAQPAFRGIIALEGASYPY